jgi:hypothetical protein
MIWISITAPRLRFFILFTPRSARKLASHGACLFGSLCDPFAPKSGVAQKGLVGEAVDGYVLQSAY